ncbi:hypothetical protein LCGC14_2073510, partial [marine sediment metagenome]
MDDIYNKYVHGDGAHMVITVMG